MVDLVEIERSLDDVSDDFTVFSSQPLNCSQLSQKHLLYTDVSTLTTLNLELLELNESISYLLIKVFHIISHNLNPLSYLICHACQPI
jgi:hypothetical protein